MGHRFLITGIMFAIVGVVVILWTQKTSNELSTAKPLLETKSDQLQKTVILPTLNTPIPEGKTAIWCASFQMAWDEMKTKVVKEPIRLQGAQEIADRLNNSPLPPNALNPEMYYANAGLSKEGIIEKIQKDMKQRFPDVKTPEFEGNDIRAIAYAYLEAVLRFPHPYIEEPLEFNDSQGTRNKVRAFGIHQSPRSQLKLELVDQVKVLYLLQELPKGLPVMFAIDLYQDSKDYQIVVAMITKGESLVETYKDLEKKIQKDQTEASLRDFLPSDQFLVPMMHFKIDHRFRDLEKQPIENRILKGTWFDPAYQMIHFQLDETGSIIKSESKVEAKSAESKSLPKSLIFNRPYFLYVKKRDADLPFFMMWVDNSELMMKME